MEQYCTRLILLGLNALYIGLDKQNLYNFHNKTLEICEIMYFNSVFTCIKGNKKYIKRHIIIVSMQWHGLHNATQQNPLNSNSIALE